MHQPNGFIEYLATLASSKVSEAFAAVANWLVTAFSDGIFGFILGSLLIPVVGKIFFPTWNLVMNKTNQ